MKENPFRKKFKDNYRKISHVSFNTFDIMAEVWCPKKGVPTSLILTFPDNEIYDEDGYPAEIEIVLDEVDSFCEFLKQAALQCSKN